MLTKSVIISLSNGYGLEPAVLLCINRGEGKVNRYDFRYIGIMGGQQTRVYGSDAQYTYIFYRFRF